MSSGRGSQLSGTIRFKVIAEFKPFCPFLGGNPCKASVELQEQNGGGEVAYQLFAIKREARRKTARFLTVYIKWSALEQTSDV